MIAQFLPETTIDWLSSTQRKKLGVFSRGHIKYFIQPFVMPRRAGANRHIRPAGNQKVAKWSAAHCGY
jgi:hypothetical protein